MDSITQEITPIFEVKDDRFEIGQIASCNLLIEISKERFRFTIYHTKNEMFMWMEDYQIITLLNENQLLDTLEIIYRNHHFLAANYWKSISISINSGYFTYIPEELFTREESFKYLNFAAGDNTSETQFIYDYHHPKLSAFNVFGVDKKLTNWFKDMYTVKKIKPVHLISTLIEGIQLLDNHNGIHIHFEDGNFVIVYFKDNKLHFCNRFVYRTPQDATYHILFVFNQLNLNAATNITLYGEITTFSEAYVLLNKMVANLTFGMLPKSMKFSYFFDQMPEHRYCSLFSTLLTY